MKNLKTYIELIIITILVFGCKKSDTSTLVAKFEDKIEISYYADSIVFKGDKPYVRFADGFYEKYSFYGGKTKYFLVFSTVKDTTVIFYDYLGKESGMNRIKKVNDNLYKTELLLANMIGEKFWMSTIFYDKNYRILKMEKSATKNYVLVDENNK